MLERDRRRAQARRHAISVLRRQWLEKNAIWSTCANHDKTATLDGNDFWCGTTNLYFVPAPANAPSSSGLLMCFEPKCEGVWITINDLTHP